MSWSRIAVTLARCTLAAAALQLVASSAESLPQVQLRETLPSDTRPLSYQLTLEPDAELKTFGGEVLLSFAVLRPTRTVVINSSGLSVETAALEDPDTHAAATVSLNPQLQRVNFRWTQELQPGTHQLRIRYRGAIMTQAQGMFATSYPGANGNAQHMLATQLEPGDARRLLPCWDEPAQKASFQLTVRAPAELTAISNMPIAARTLLPDGRAETRFTATPPMSTYLLFLAVGDFDSIEGTSAGVLHRVWARRGDARLGQLSLNTSLQLLPFYDSYFNLPYPLPKLDHVGIAGGSVTFAAMENWGSILYFDDYLLVDPALTNVARRKFIVDSVAHEMAHQWFGDLVTMRWWDDIWLNESFASWMATKALATFHPEWNPLADTAGAREAAMALDSRAASHPIVLPVRSAAESEQVFDAISYSKGELVLRMLERYMGEDAFRAGLRRYMAKHRLSTSTSLDLWRELAQSSGLPIQQIARDFTTQAGVPLLHVLSERCDVSRQHTLLTVRQERFGMDAESRRPQNWTLPVIAEVAGATATTQRLVRGGSAQQLEVAGCGAVIVNAGGDGYYRTAYPDEHYVQLQRALPQLPPVDQLVLLNDTRALGAYGYLPLRHFFAMAGALPATADPLVLRRVAGSITGLLEDARELDNLRDLQAWARRWLRPVLALTGWEIAPGESDNLRDLRANVIVALGIANDAEAIAEARRRFDRAENGGPALDASLRRAVTQIVARTADQATFDHLLARARASRSHLESRLYYSTLAAVHDAALAQQALERSLDASTPAQQSSEMIHAVAFLHPELCFDFVAARYSELGTHFTNGELTSLYADVARSGHSERLVRRLNEVARRELPPAAAKPVAEAVSAIHARMLLRQQLAALPPLAGPSIAAQPASVYRTITPSADGIGRVYMGREIAYVMGHEGAEWLERRTRQQEEGTDRLVPLLGLRPGDSVADIGAGTGYFSFQLSQAVPHGKVYAVDVQPEMLALIQQRRVAGDGANVIAVLGEIADPKLPANSVDLILLVDAYHEFSEPRAMGEAMVRALKPGGRIALVEYRAEDPQVPIKELHKMSEAQAKKEMTVLGLTWQRTDETLPWQHLMFFAKPGN